MADKMRRGVGRGKLIANGQDSGEQKAPAKGDLIHNEFERQAADMVLNAMSMRMKWLQKLYGSRRARDVGKECRLPDVSELESSDYRDMFDHNGVGKRVVVLEPQESWQMMPEIIDSQDADETEFEMAVKTLDRRHNLLAQIYKADVLCGIGRFGVMLLGINDGEDDLSQPVDGVPESGRLEDATNQLNYELLFVRVLDESLVEIVEWESDTQSVRFGQPKMYNLTLLSSRDQKSAHQNTEPMQTNQKVHWTRIVHFADNTLSNEFLGTPRMQEAYWNLVNIDKIMGGDGEGFWQGAFPGLSFESQPDQQFLELDTRTLKKQMNRYSEGYQRWLATVGLNVKSLAVQVTDPNPHFEAQCKMIAMGKGCPFRVFMGTEEAKLAGGQDSEAWDGRMSKRRDDRIEPFCVRPVIDRLVIFGCLPMPNYEPKPKETPQLQFTPQKVAQAQGRQKPTPRDTQFAQNLQKIVDKAVQEGKQAKKSNKFKEAYQNGMKYMIDWPDLTAPSASDVAKTCQLQVSALKDYIQGNVNELITPEDFLTIFMKLDPEQVEVIIVNAYEQLGQMNQNQNDMLLGGPTEDQIRQEEAQKFQQQDTQRQIKDLKKMGVKKIPKGLTKNRLRKWMLREFKYKLIENFNPNHDEKGLFSSGSGGGGSYTLGHSIKSGNSMFMKDAGIAFPKAEGAKIPQLDKGQIYLARYSTEDETLSGAKIGFNAYGGAHIDDVVNSTAAYAKDTSKGFLHIGRYIPEEWDYGLEEESDGREVNKTLGSPEAPVEVVIDLSTGEVHRKKYSVKNKSNASSTQRKNKRKKSS